jgi:hypothetical protein
MSTFSTDPHPSTLRIHQAGELAAIATRDGVHLTPAIAAMPEHHPSRHRVLLKAMIAGAILNGKTPGPYCDEEAELLADMLIEAETTDRRRTDDRP